MQKTLWILAIGFLFVSVAMADSACSTQSLDNYLVANYMCHIDGLDFSNFVFNNPANPPGISIPATSINVTPINDPVNGPTFVFSETMSVANQGSTQESQDIQVGFTATGLNGNLIDDLFIGFNGSFTGTGTTDFTESWCFVNENPLLCSGHDFHVSNPPGSTFSNEVDFASPHSVVTVFKDVSVASGISGTASISKFDNAFSTVPEPAYTSLLVAGLLGLGWLRKRRQSQV